MEKRTETGTVPESDQNEGIEIEYIKWRVLGSHWKVKFHFVTGALVPGRLKNLE